jgi:hypothetical protein
MAQIVELDRSEVRTLLRLLIAATVRVVVQVVAHVRTEHNVSVAREVVALFESGKRVHRFGHQGNAANPLSLGHLLHAELVIPVVADVKQTADEINVPPTQAAFRWPS